MGMDCSRGNMMDEFTAFDSQTEVIGQMMIAFLESGDKTIARKYLVKHGLSDIKPDQWYPLQTWLNVLRDMTRAGDSLNLVDIGMQLVQTAVLPPGFTDLPLKDALMMMNEANKLNNRNGDIGEYTVEQIADYHIKVTTRLPYPDDWLYGMFYGGARRFLPLGTAITVTYDPVVPRRKDGGDVTIFHIRWELNTYW